MRIAKEEEKEHGKREEQEWGVGRFRIKHSVIVSRYDSEQQTCPLFPYKSSQGSYETAY
jgi:mRNA-degrading endonuclease RelE of RelBE toxin-antitoxin system